jgi:4'-phosphopantetheinyl transferase
MAALGWLSRRLAEVPPGDEWLGEDERAALATMHVERRRADWRLGRFAAKAAVGAWLGVPPSCVQILAASDGAPEAWLDGCRADISVTLSHRGGVALAAVMGSAARAGCDLELVEPRSDAFIRDWLSPAEAELVRGGVARDRDLLANLIWAAKEAAAKVRREGLRLDPLHATVTLGGPIELSAARAWRPLRVEWRDRLGPTYGWWGSDSGFVMVVAGEPAPDRPRALERGIVADFESLLEAGSRR